MKYRKTGKSGAKEQMRNSRMRFFLRWSEGDGIITKGTEQQENCKKPVQGEINDGNHMG